MGYAVWTRGVNWQPFELQCYLTKNDCEYIFSICFSVLLLTRWYPIIIVVCDHKNYHGCPGNFGQQETRQGRLCSRRRELKGLPCIICHGSKIMMNIVSLSLFLALRGLTLCLTLKNFSVKLCRIQRLFLVIMALCIFSLFNYVKSKLSIL